jgi:hypothetical protein
VKKNFIIDLIDTIVLPFDNMMFNDARLKDIFESEEKRANHNMALAKLAILIANGKVDEIKAALKEAAIAHNEYNFDKEILRDYLNLFFALMKGWIGEYYPQKSEQFLKDVKEYEKVFMDAYKPFIEDLESDDGFLMFDGESVDESINKMHYKETEKTDAKTFMDEGIFDIDLIHDIRDLNNDLIHYNTTQASFTQEYIEAITKIFESYAKVFDLSYEFRDLAYAIRVLNSKLIELKIDDIDDNQVSMYKMFLDTVGEDLVKWANEILFEQSAKDIHYLDASLLANIAQIDLMMNISEMTIEDDDIFF